MVDPTYSSSYSVRQPRAAAIVLFTMTAVGQNATDNDMVLIERGTHPYEFGDLGHGARICRRTHEAQRHPAARADMQIERAAGHQRCAEPRHWITQNDAITGGLMVDHDRTFAKRCAAPAKKLGSLWLTFT